MSNSNHPFFQPSVAPRWFEGNSICNLILKTNGNKIRATLSIFSILCVLASIVWPKVYDNKNVLDQGERHSYDHLWCNQYCHLFTVAMDDHTIWYQMINCTGTVRFMSIIFIGIVTFDNRIERNHRMVSVEYVSFSLEIAFYQFRFFAMVLSVFCSTRNNAGPKSQLNQRRWQLHKNYTITSHKYTQMKATWWISASRQKHAPKRIDQKKQRKK